MPAPSEKQLDYIEILLDARGNGYYSAAYAEISRRTGARQKDATRGDASRTIEAIKNEQADR